MEINVPIFQTKNDEASVSSFSDMNVDALNGKFSSTFGAILVLIIVLVLLG